MICRNISAARIPMAIEKDMWAKVENDMPD